MGPAGFWDRSGGPSDVAIGPACATHSKRLLGLSQADLSGDVAWLRPVKPTPRSQDLLKDECGAGVPSILSIA